MTTTTTPAPASDERLPEPIQTGAYFINVNEGTELPMCLLSATPGDYAPFTLYEAVRASELASMRTALAAKDAELAALRTVMVAAAEEIAAHWDAHCDAEGYGPQNLMRRLEEGIPSEYGYTAGAFAELKAKAEVRGVPGGLTEMMRHVRRVQAHVQDWWAWYGGADVLLRNQLPLPPSRSPQILEDLDAAIAAATPSPTEPAMPAERVALSDESIEAIIERHAGGCDWSDDEHESAVSLIRSVIAELNGITPAQ